MAAKEKPSHDQTSEGSEPGSLEKSVVDNLASARETLAAIDALNVRWKVNSNNGQSPDPPSFLHVHRLRKKSLPRSCRSRCWARSVSSPNQPAPSRMMRSLASWEATPRSTSSVGGWALGSTRGWWWWRGREWALRPEFQTSVAQGVASTIRWKGGRTYPVPNLCLTLNSSRRTPSPSSPWPNSYIPASTHRRMHTTLSDTCPTVAFCFVATHRWGTGHVCVRVYVSDPPWVV